VFWFSIFPLIFSRIFEAAPLQNFSSDVEHYCRGRWGLIMPLLLRVRSSVQMLWNREHR
jgi:hypothetical protein